jgi:hypothetical protein
MNVSLVSKGVLNVRNFTIIVHLVRQDIILFNTQVIHSANNVNNNV